MKFARISSAGSELIAPLIVDSKKIEATLHSEPTEQTHWTKRKAAKVPGVHLMIHMDLWN